MMQREATVSSETMMAAADMTSINAAISSAVSQLENISSLKGEQRTTLKAFLDGKDVFALLPTDFGKSLIYQLVLLVIWFVDLIGRKQ